MVKVPSQQGWNEEMVDYQAWLDSTQCASYEVPNPITSDTPVAFGRAQPGCKFVFGYDDRGHTAVDEFPVLVMDRYTAQTSPGTVWTPTNQNLFSPVNCSATFITEDYLLTAGHCVYDTRDNRFLFANSTDQNLVQSRPAPVRTDLGMVDEGRGYVCLPGRVDTPELFQQNCEFVDGRRVPTGFVDAYKNIFYGNRHYRENDFAVVRLRRDQHPRGLGFLRTVRVSRLERDDQYESKVNAYSYAYPGWDPWGWANAEPECWQEAGANCGIFRNGLQIWQIFSFRQFLSWGSILPATTDNLLRTRQDASPGHSGAGVLYRNASNSAWYIIGVTSGPAPGYMEGPTSKNFGPYVRSVVPGL